MISPTPSSTPKNWPSDAPDWFDDDTDARVLKQVPGVGTVYFVAWPKPDPTQVELFDFAQGEERGAYLIVHANGKEVWTSTGPEWAAAMLTGDWSLYADVRGSTADPDDADPNEDPENDEQPDHDAQP